MTRGKPTPEHVLFFRYGKLELGAIGRPAIVALVALVAGVVTSKALGLW